MCVVQMGVSYVHMCIVQMGVSYVCLTDGCVLCVLYRWVCLKYACLEMGVSCLCVVCMLSVFYWWVWPTCGCVLQVGVLCIVCLN